MSSRYANLQEADRATEKDAAANLAANEKKRNEAIQAIHNDKLDKLKAYLKISLFETKDYDLLIKNPEEQKKYLDAIEEMEQLLIDQIRENLNKNPITVKKISDDEAKQRLFEKCRLHPLQFTLNKPKELTNLYLFTAAIRMCVGFVITDLENEYKNEQTQKEISDRRQEADFGVIPEDVANGGATRRRRKRKQNKQTKRKRKFVRKSVRKLRQKLN